MTSMKSTRQCWSNMKQRCLNKRNAQFKYYGARGISVCEKWINSFDAFLADMGERPAGKTIDRINNDGNYEPVNCRWITLAEQQTNRRDCVYLEFDGKRMTVREWASHIGRHRSTLGTRIKAGYPIHLILSPDLLLGGCISPIIKMEKIK